MHIVRRLTQKLSNRQIAGHHGWHVDRDGWYVRHRRAGDRDIIDAPSVGFTMPDEVYVRTPEQALQYDRGVIEAPISVHRDDEREVAWRCEKCRFTYFPADENAIECICPRCGCHSNKID